MSWWASGAQPVHGRPALSEMPAGRGAGGAESQRVGGLTGGVVPVPAGRGGLRAHGLRDARAVVGHAALADIGAVAAAGRGEPADCAAKPAPPSQVRGPEAAAGGAPSREGHARAARATILRAENMLGRMVGFWEISGRGLDLV